MFQGDSSQMIINWVTQNSTGTSVVEYGTLTGLSKVATGNEKVFVDGGPEKRCLYMHTVLLQGLQPRQKYGKYH